MNLAGLFIGGNMSGQEVAVSTSETIPGRPARELKGVVVGVGTAAWGFYSSNKASRALLKAMNEIRGRATASGANAIVSLQVEATSSGFIFNRAHTVIITGTAVNV